MYFQNMISANGVSDWRPPLSNRCVASVCAFAVGIISFFFYLFGTVLFDYYTASNVQFSSDAITYYDIASQLGELPSFSLNANLLLPIGLINLTGDAFWVVSLINVFVLVACTYWIFSVLQVVSVWPYFVFFLLSPLTFFSAQAVNKEMISLLPVCFVVVATRNKSFGLFSIGVVIAFFVRWQLSLILILGWIIVLVQKKYGWIVSMVVLCCVMSLIGMAVERSKEILDSVFLNAETGRLLDEGVGSGGLGYLTSVSSLGGGSALGVMWLPISIWHQFGPASRLGSGPIDENFWNYVVLALHALFGIGSVLFVFFARRVSRLPADLICFTLVTWAILSASPIPSNRYYFTGHFLVSLLACLGGDGARGVAAGLAFNGSPGIRRSKDIVAS